MGDENVGITKGKFFIRVLFFTPQTENRGMNEYDLEMMWKEKVVDYFEILHRNFLTGTEKYLSKAGLRIET